MTADTVDDGWFQRSTVLVLEPNTAQERALRSHCGASRKVGNDVLGHVEKVIETRAAERAAGVPDADLTPSVSWSRFSLGKWWTSNRDVLCGPWVEDLCQEALRFAAFDTADALRAWSDSRSGKRKGPPVGFPHHHSKHRTTPSCRFGNDVRVLDPRHLRFPKVGPVKVRGCKKGRTLARLVGAGDAKVQSVTVRFEHGRWWAAVQHRVRRTPPVRRPKPPVGADLGLRSFLVVARADGTVLDQKPGENRPYRDGFDRKLKRLQRTAARRQGPYDPVTGKGRRPSNRWKRTQDRIRKVHAADADRRGDMLHKATAELARNHTTVVVEDLNVRGMVSKGGAHKRGLNRAVSRASFAEFRRQLDYKTEWWGGTVVEADRFYPSSKTCSGCGGRKPSLSLSEREYRCTECGLRLDRDVNAAVNLARLADTPGPGPAGAAGVGRAAGTVVPGRATALRKTSPVPRVGLRATASTPRQTPVLPVDVGTVGTRRSRLGDRTSVTSGHR